MTDPHNSSFGDAVFRGGYSSTPHAFSSGLNGRRQNGGSQNFSLMQSPSPFVEQQDQLYRVPAMSGNGANTNSWQPVPYNAPSQMDYNGPPSQGQNIDIAGLEPSSIHPYYHPGGMPQDVGYPDNVFLPEYDAGAEPSNVGGWDLDRHDHLNTDASSRMRSIDDLTKPKDDSPWSVFTNHELDGLTDRPNTSLYRGSAGSATSGTGLITDYSPSEYVSMEEVSDQMLDSIETINPNNIAGQSMNSRQQPHQDFGSEPTGFRFRIRESTPGPQTPGFYQNQNPSSYRPPPDSGHLPVPRHSRSNSVASSRSSTSSEPSKCGYCGKPYKGVYRRGNLARHVRLKHGVKVVMYKCEIPGCDREYFRQDARLKHYRKSH